MDQMWDVGCPQGGEQLSLRARLEEEDSAECPQLPVLLAVGEVSASVQKWGIWEPS